ncbi:MAG: energy transducer TonB [Leadbetterella sp.]
MNILVMFLAFSFSCSSANERKDLRNLSLIQKPKSFQKDTLDEEIYVSVEEPAEFPGGIASLYKFVGENMKYLNKPSKENIRTKIFVKFVVEKDGTLSNIQIVKSLGVDNDKETIRFIKSMPKFKPARHKGKVCRYMFNLPITCIKWEE